MDNRTDFDRLSDWLRSDLDLGWGTLSADLEVGRRSLRAGNVIEAERVLAPVVSRQEEALARLDADGAEWLSTQGLSQNSARTALAHIRKILRVELREARELHREALDELAAGRTELSPARRYRRYNREVGRINARLFRVAAFFTVPAAAYMIFLYRFNYPGGVLVGVLVIWAVVTAVWVIALASFLVHVVADISWAYSDLSGALKRLGWREKWFWLGDLWRGGGVARREWIRLGLVVLEIALWVTATVALSIVWTSCAQ